MLKTFIALVTLSLSAFAQTDRKFFIPDLAEPVDSVAAKMGLDRQDCASFLQQLAANANTKAKKHSGSSTPFMVERHFPSEKETRCLDLANAVAGKTVMLEDAPGDADRGAWSLHVTFSEGKVIGATAGYYLGQGLQPNPAFEEIVSSATRRFGDPHRFTTTVQNAYGAKFDLRNARWDFSAGGSLLVSEELHFETGIVSGYMHPIYIVLTDGVDRQQKPKTDPFAK